MSGLGDDTRLSGAAGSQRRAAAKVASAAAKVAGASSSGLVQGSADGSADTPAQGGSDGFPVVMGGEQVQSGVIRRPPGPLTAWAAAPPDGAPARERLARDRTAIAFGSAPLAGRYRVTRVLRSGPGFAWVAAIDQRSGATVGVEIVDVVDAAAGGLAPHRLGGAGPRGGLAELIAHGVLDAHVPRVFRAGTCGSGGPFYRIVESPVEWAQERPMFAQATDTARPASLRQAVLWAAQVAQGLSAAHVAGAYHLALAAEYVAVRPASGRVQVLGLHLCWPVGGRAGSPAGLSDPPQQGHQQPPLWAPFSEAQLHCMAPEWGETVGAGGPAPSARALRQLDVHALGVVLFEWIAGGLPVDAGAAASVDGRSAPAARAAMDFNAQTCFGAAPWPRSLVRIIECATAVDPARRYESCAGLRRDLLAFAFDRPTSLERASWSVCSRLWLRRARRRLLFTVRLVAAGCMLWALWNGYRRLAVANGEGPEVPIQDPTVEGGAPVVPDGDLCQ